MATTIGAHSAWTPPQPGRLADRRRGPDGPRIGLVLGAGAARGWAHIGALRAMERLGLVPDLVVGCSSGALVGASYCAGRLDRLEHFARTLTWRGVLGYFDVTWRGGGLIEGRWLVDFFRKHIGDSRIEDSPVRFGAVATELRSGRETWLTEGSIVDAVRASVALPGLVTPIAIGGQWLVDGALVNPIPVSLCRALGADAIVAVSMQGDLVTSPRPQRAPAAPPAPMPGAPMPERSSWMEWLGSGGPLSGYFSNGAPPPVRTSIADLVGRAGARPTSFEVIGDSFFTVQNFVSRIRLAADPVDVLISPKLDEISVFDFHRGAEAIAAGEAAVEAKAEELCALFGGACLVDRNKVDRAAERAAQSEGGAGA